MAGTSTYPTIKDAFATNHVDLVQEKVHASSMNELADAANKIENELGVLPKGVYQDVKTRLDTLERFVFNFISGTTYQLAVTDASKVVSPTNAAGCTITIPLLSTAPFLGGTVIQIRQGSLCPTVTVQAVSGVKFESRGSTFTLAGPIAWATLVMVDDDEWNLFGDLS